jgi:hypothetical protein
MGHVLTWPVDRDAQGQRVTEWPPFGPIAAYVLGALIGGAATGLVIAAAAAEIRDAVGSVPVAGGAGTLALSAAALQWQGRVAPLPESSKQVPRRWLLWGRRALTALAFGLVIGAGAFTRLRHAAAYALLAVIALAPSVGVGVLIGSTYGLSRGATVFMTWFGDRFLGTRPAWSALAQRPLIVNRVLAVVALTAVATAISLVF